jgi:acyl-CoA thioesterase-1
MRLWLQARSPLRRIEDVQRLGLLLILTAICGCSADKVKTDASISTPGPSTSVAAATPTAAPAVSDVRPVIVCFGDSLTAGYGVDPDLSYPANMQRDLDAKGYLYRVVNMGVSGETTKDGLSRVPRVLALKPELVVVEFGGNDGLRGLPIGTTQQNLDAIVDALKKGGPRVAMAAITLPPDYGADYINRFNAMYPAIAKKHGVALLPFIYKDVYGLPGYIQDDGVHATAKGNIQVAKNIEGLITPMLRK